MTARPIAVLACLVDRATAAGAAREWSRLLAPEVALREVPPDTEDVTALAGPCPYALLAAGALGGTGFEWAVRLSDTDGAPTRLLVWECPPPAADGPRLSCPVVAFADPETADDMAAWRTATTGGFTLRLLTGSGLPPQARATPEVALALKEELQVWPY